MMLNIFVSGQNDFKIGIYLVNSYIKLNVQRWQKNRRFWTVLDLWIDP